MDDDSSAAGLPRIRLMCSFGGRILPRPHDHQLRYVGGDTRMISIPRSSTFSSLLSKLSNISNISNISIKYQLPNEDLDSLVSITSDEDLDNMFHEFYRFSKSPRLRLFLFQPEPISTTAFGSESDDNWFLDALNGSNPNQPTLDRGRSEVSSIVSEVPDYLFGFDNNSDGTPTAGPVPRADLFGLSSEKIMVEPPPVLETGSGGIYGSNPVWQGPVYYVPGPATYAHPVVGGQGSFGYPVQAVAGNPVYVGGVQRVMAAATAVYEYPMQAVVGEAYEVVGGGRGLIRQPTVMNSPMYQSPGITPAGVELLPAAGTEFMAGRRSQ